MLLQRLEMFASIFDVSLCNSLTHLWLGPTWRLFNKQNVCNFRVTLQPAVLKRSRYVY